MGISVKDAPTPIEAESPFDFQVNGTPRKLVWLRYVPAPACSDDAVEIEQIAVFRLALAWSSE